MYAVIKTGGKQHRVKPGDIIEIELMHAKDDSVEFHPLLVVDDDNKTHVGKEIAKATVTGKLVGEQKGEKVKVFKYRNKTGYARHTGHRQMYTLVEIGEIKLPGQPAALCPGCLTGSSMPPALRRLNPGKAAKYIKIANFSGGPQSRSGGR